jgi:hypothetical protein
MPEVTFTAFFIVNYAHLCFITGLWSVYLQLSFLGMSFFSLSKLEFLR